ncbi:MAG: hypothetical protein ACI9FB_002997 [Candidatus Azotimanducaceae bacterium]|jgi:hypothetical protein
MKWKVITFIIAIPLMIAISPELAAMGAFIQMMGLEILLPLFEVQLIALVTYVYRDQLKPALIFLHNLLRKLDSNYFLPSPQLISQCPPMILHAIPGLVSFYWLFFVLM